MKEFIHNIQYFFFKRALKSLLSKNMNHQGMNYNTAQTIGIIYDAGILENEESVHFFVQKLSAKEKEVSILGYLEKVEKGQEIPTHIFTKNDLNWNLIPNTEKAALFVSTDFDILICLQNINIPAIEYITAMSNAKFRVGKYFKNKEPYYELMIQDEENGSIKNLIRQIDSFLSNLKMAAA